MKAPPVKTETMAPLEFDQYDETWVKMGSSRLIWIVSKSLLEVFGRNGFGNDTKIVSVQDGADGGKDGDEELVDFWFEHHVDVVD